MKSEINLVSSDAILMLHLERRWFEMIVDGVKRCEYRDLRKYNSRFRNQDGTIHHFDFVVFALGYPPFRETSRWAAFRVSSISVAEGVPEWGARSGVLYWCIELGQCVDALPWLSWRLLKVNQGCIGGAI